MINPLPSQAGHVIQPIFPSPLQYAQLFFRTPDISMITYRTGPKNKHAGPVGKQNDIQFFCFCKPYPAD